MDNIGAKIPMLFAIKLNTNLLYELSRIFGLMTNLVNLDGKKSAKPSFVLIRAFNSCV